LKTGLVLEGGGMKCAYGAGILDRFLDDNIIFDYVIGVSAGSANGASFVAHQRGRSLRFYTDHIVSKDYYGIGSYLKKGDLFGLDYIYSTLTNSDGKDPLDHEAMMESPAEFEVVVTNAVTGKPEYYSKHDMPKDDYEYVKASSCIPAVCRPRKIGENFYYDGGLSDPIPIGRAFDQGCDKVVVVLSKPRDYVRSPQKFRFFYQLKCRRFPEVIKIIDNRHIEYKKQFEHIFELEKEGRIFVFSPSRQMNTGTYKMDPELNRQVYDLGIADYEEQKEKLLEYLKH